MKFIAGELLKREGKTIMDLAETLKPDGPSYRTIYAYFRRGGGTLEIGAMIAKGMGKTLNDIYVEDEYVIPASANKVNGEYSSGASEDSPSAILKAIVNFNDSAEVQRTVARLGREKLYDTAQLCIDMAKNHKDSN